MALTGPLLQWGTAVLALVAAAALVAGWARLARRGLLAVLARTAALAGVNALVLLAVLVTANDQFTFYSDYQDLIGSSGTTTVSRAGAPASAGTTTATAADRAAVAGSAVPHRAAPPRQAGPGSAVPHRAAPHDHGVPVPGTGGRVERLDVRGASGTSGYALVLLPAGYSDRANATRSYPVLEAFHGYPAAPQQWLGAMQLQRSLDDAVATHRLAPTLVVLPDVQDPPGRDTECLDGPPGQPQVESWVTSDVPQAVEGSYRVRADARSWATAGLSMGGWCAAMATMLHPQQYSAALVFGGYFHYLPGDWLPFPRGSAGSAQHDLVALARTTPPAVAVWASTSEVDHLSYPSTSAFVAGARAPLAVTALVRTHGGHRTSLWVSQVPQALEWLGRTEPGFAPTR